MAKALLEWETIDADQIDDIMAGQAAASAEAGAPTPGTTSPDVGGTAPSANPARRADA